MICFPFTMGLVEEFLIVAGAHVLAVVSPGPDFALVVKSSVTESRTNAIYTALGIALGLLVHIAYSMLGIALIVSRSIVLFNVIRYLGAAYLVYLGVRALLAGRQAEDAGENMGEVAMKTRWGSVVQGFLTNALNPKATLFFLGLFTQVIKPETGLLTQLAYGTEMVVVTFVWFSLVATVLSTDRVLASFKRIRHRVNQAFGVVLVALGAKIATS